MKKTASFKVDLGTCSTLARLSCEGWGTAYEYYVKSALISEKINGITVDSILVYGLPEKYGLSLDHIFLGKLLGVPVTVVDERQNVLDRVSEALKSPKSKDLFHGIECTLTHAEKLANPPLTRRFDVSFNMEVIQRLAEKDKSKFMKTARKLSNRVFSFAPNKGNSMHNRFSGLASVSLSELLRLCEESGLRVADSGFIDMPPFPPGVKKPGDSSEGFGLLDAVFPPSLKAWSSFEGFCPISLKSRYSHIVYAYSSQPG